MRDVPCGHGPMPGGVWRRLGRVEVQARPDRSAVGVAKSVLEPECSSPLRRKKGRTVEVDLWANLNIRWMVYFYVCGGGLVLQCKQRKHFVIRGASSICHGFDPLSLFQHFVLQTRHLHQSILLW